MKLSRTARTVRIASALGLLLTAALLAACTKQAAAPGTTSAAATEKDAATPKTLPTIKLVTPTEGAKVASGDLTVTVETTDLKYTMPSNKNLAGQGHVHFTLDDRPFLMSIEPTIKIENVAPGTHKLVVEAVQNDTKSFDPPVEQEITFVTK